MMRPATPVAGGAMLALLLAGQAQAAEPIRTPERTQTAWVSAKQIKQKDADRALRETLIHAADAATQRLGRAGAYADDPARRVSLPEPLRSMRGTWNDVGRSGALEKLETAMNVAAEAAAPLARPVLLEAVGDIDFSDAVEIVRSGDEAASQFFAIRSRAQIEMRLRPAIELTLAQAGAFAALDQAAAAGGAPQKAGEYRGKVVAATLAREIDALFAEMRAEEREIRADPSGRGSPLLKDVFSAYGAPRPQANAGG